MQPLPHALLFDPQCLQHPLEPDDGAGIVGIGANFGASVGRLVGVGTGAGVSVGGSKVAVGGASTIGVGVEVSVGVGSTTWTAGTPSSVPTTRIYFELPEIQQASPWVSVT